MPCAPHRLYWFKSNVFSQVTIGGPDQHGTTVNTDGDPRADEPTTLDRRVAGRDAVAGSPVVVLFGAPALTDHVGRRTPIGRRETQLLAYLALHRDRPHPRHVLASVLWPDLPEGRARKSLSTTLWRLRRDFEERGIEREHFLLRTGSTTVELVVHRPEALDVATFEAALDPLQPGDLQDPVRLRATEAAVALYRGDLLEGFYEEWVVLHRERLRLAYLNALGALMAHHRHADPARAVGHGEAILRADPLRESVHRALMRLHVDLGQRARALRQYEACREILRDELGVSPMEETRALHGRILRGEPAEAPSPRTPDTPWRSPDARRPAADRIARLSAELERIARHLDRARRLLGDPPSEPGEGEGDPL